jgi:hypothetical protein
MCSGRLDPSLLPAGGGIRAEANDFKSVSIAYRNSADPHSACGDKVVTVRCAGWPALLLHGSAVDGVAFAVTIIIFDSARRVRRGYRVARQGESQPR